MIERSPISEGLHHTENIVKPRFVKLPLKLLSKNYYDDVHRCKSVTRYLRFVIKYYPYVSLDKKSNEIIQRKIYFWKILWRIIISNQTRIPSKIIFFYRQTVENNVIAQHQIFWEIKMYFLPQDCRESGNETRNLYLQRAFYFH